MAKFWDTNNCRLLPYSSKLVLERLCWGFYCSKGWRKWWVVTTGAVKKNRHHQHSNTRRFTGQMPFLSPNWPISTLIHYKTISQYASRSFG